MSDTGKNDPGNNKSTSGFSWSAEKKAALDRCDPSGTAGESEKSKKSHASSIFSSYPDERRDLKGGYQYDYPSDDGYIYRPLAAGRVHGDSTGAAPVRRTQKPQPQKKQSASYGGKASGTRSRTERQTVNGQRQTDRKADPRANGKSGKTAPSNNKPGASKRQPSKPTGKKKSSTQGTASKKRQPSPTNRKNVPDHARKAVPSGNSRNAQRQNDRTRREHEQIQKRTSKANNDYARKRAKGKSGDEIISEAADKKRRSGKFYAIMSVAVVIVVAGICAFAFCMLKGAPIVSIIVEGNKTYTQQEILQAAGIAVGDNMLRIRQKKTDDKLTQSLPYIGSVIVDYQLPDTLRLEITETDDKFLIVNGSVYICVDAEGKVLSDAKKKAKTGKYRLDGFTEQQYEIGKRFVPDKDSGNSEKYELARQIAAAVEKVGLKICRIIDLSDTDYICISCGSDIRIYCDSKTPFERRLEIAKDQIEAKYKSGVKSSFDLRFSDMVVCKDGDFD